MAGSDFTSFKSILFACPVTSRPQGTKHRDREFKGRRGSSGRWDSGLDQGDGCGGGEKGSVYHLKAGYSVSTAYNGSF